MKYEIRPEPAGGGWWVTRGPWRKGKDGENIVARCHTLNDATMVCEALNIWWPV